MGVLALDKGLLGVVFQINHAVLRAHIHRAHYVSEVLVISCIGSPFILHRTGGVLRLEPVVACLEIRAEAGLVAHAPYNDGGMISVSLNHALVADKVGGRVHGLFGQGLFTVAHSVGFHVGLVHNVKAESVAEGEPEGIVRIVAGADGVHVQALHNPDVLHHLLFSDDIAFVGRHFVTIDALYKHRLPVHEELLPADFHRAEAYPEGGAFNHLQVVKRLYLKGIEVGLLRAPELYPGEFCRCLRLPLLNPGLEAADHFIIVHKRISNAGDSGGDGGRGGKVSVHIGHNVDVLQAVLAARAEIDVAGQAGEAPEVLVLQVRAVAPAEDFKGDDVHAGAHHLGHVEVGFQLAVLAVAHGLAVYPYPHVGGGAANG